SRRQTTVHSLLATAVPSRCVSPEEDRSLESIGPAASSTTYRSHRGALKNGRTVGSTSSTTTMPERVGPPALLLTKLHPPPSRAQTVVRDRLVAQLRPRPEVKLTVVAAPAGCGKTTLLGMWREAEAARRPIAWVTLDEGDDDPVVL